jgi:2-polyprenyl-3-methyl-5-hydroxy-6-metoxy-1,4-benzoquinol methylase
MLNSRLDFSRRVSPHELPERMDAECNYENYRTCLLNLENINRWFLGYRPTLRWLEQLPRWSRPIHIVDLGSGGGDLLRQIAHWAKRRNVPVQLTGIDLNPLSTRAAIEFTPKELGVTWITGNAMAHRSREPIDIVVSSLMTHHLEDEEVVQLLQWMEATARVGWFINDLERSERSYRMFGLLPWQHPIISYDGLVSFRRAFCMEDWRRLLHQAGILETKTTVERWRPGRLCVGRWKEPGGGV